MTCKEKRTMIGIDLGTTYSCVGAYLHGKVEIIANDQGNRTTPSYLAFNSEGERLIGDAAKSQLVRNFANTVYNSKRLIGREWIDETVQRDISSFSFNVVNKNGKPQVELQTSNGKKEFAAEEISALILGKMKATAEDYLGHPVSQAVVTVPANFNDAQRRATKLAGSIAGFESVRMINEPTAAAIAYGMYKTSAESNILVFDLGGGTVDVSLLTINKGHFTVRATVGDTHLGGEDFDQRVIDYFLKLYKEKKNKDFSKNNRSIQRLRREVETAKKALSTCNQVRIEIDAFFQGEDFSESLSRAKFEELNKDLFQSAIKPLENIFLIANMHKNKIDEVVLVGGSTRIPKIQSLVKEFFDGKELVKSINPDEAIAHGATALASMLSGEYFSSTIVLKEITPLTLGIDCEDYITKERITDELIPRNTTIPTIKTKNLTTTTDNQVSVKFPIYEGENRLSKDNHLLGEFVLNGIRPSPKGVPQLEVTFKIDEEGILEVSAKDLENGNKEQVTITNYKEQLSTQEIALMIKDAKLLYDEN